MSMDAKSAAIAEIEELYGQHDPPKIAEVPALAAKYGEAELLRMVRKKYNVNRPSQPAAAASTGLMVEMILAMPSTMSILPSKSVSELMTGRATWTRELTSARSHIWFVHREQTFRKAVAACLNAPGRAMAERRYWRMALRLSWGNFPSHAA